MALVVDASIVGCWCFPDEANPIADVAFDQLGATAAVVPALWCFEVRNLLLVNERRGRLDAAGTAEFLADLGGCRSRSMVSRTADQCWRWRERTG